MPIAPKPLPTKEMLNFFLSYDAATGVLTWRNPPHRNCPQYVGTRAGFVDVREYKGVEVRVAGQRCRAHRVIWKMVHDEEPIEIDHKDGNPCNNRLDNLRAADKPRNAMNTRCMRNKQLATLKGCYRPRGKNYWIAQIKKDGKYYYLGTFKTEQEAHDAYVKKAKELFGEFANAGYREGTAVDISLSRAGS